MYLIMKGTDTVPTYDKQLDMVQIKCIDSKGNTVSIYLTPEQVEMAQQKIFQEKQ